MGETKISLVDTIVLKSGQLFGGKIDQKNKVELNFQMIFSEKELAQYIQNKADSALQQTATVNHEPVLLRLCN